MRTTYQRLRWNSLFDNLDTTHVTGNLEVDTQFIKDNLSNSDKEFFRLQLQKIMSVGNDRMDERKENNVPFTK